MFIYVYNQINKGCNMEASETTVISIRVKKTLKANLEREGIDVEKRLKDDLTQLGAQLEWRKTVARHHDLIKKYVKPSKKGWAVRTVRHDRYAVH
jgi:hypothetical protein